MGTIWIILIAIGGAYLFIELVHAIGYMSDLLNHDNAFFIGFLIREIKRATEKQKSKAEWQKNYKENKKLIGRIQIIELMKEDDTFEYMVRKATHIDSRGCIGWNHLMDKAPHVEIIEGKDITVIKEGLYWARKDLYRSDYIAKFESSELAQESANNLETEIKKKDTRENYSKVVGEFSV